MARSDPQLNFRIPADLRIRLEKSAEANKRSLTAELVERLEESFDGKTVRLPDAIAERLQKDAAEHGWPFESELLHMLVDAIGDRDNPPATPSESVPAEVDWGKRLELRANELRLDTVRTHLFAAQQVAAQLADEARALKAKNAAKEVQLTLRDRAAVVAAEVERLNRLHAALLEENVQLVRSVDEAYRPINEQLDSAADVLNQPHYNALAASEDVLGVPASKRVIVRRAK